MMQGFEWYIPADHKHWRRLKHALPGLRRIGVSNMWIPPACKAAHWDGNGYDVYDLYDLGEFDAKGSVATKWGSKQELVELCQEADRMAIGIYFDAVLNHKAAADRVEKCPAVEVDPKNRLKISGKPEEIEAWTGFDFSARNNKYCAMKYHWHHFSGIDYNAAKNKSVIYKILGPNKQWATDVSDEHGNYDYLMFADLDYTDDEVRQDVMSWGIWLTKELRLKGFRFDAIKHYSEQFLLDFIRNLEDNSGASMFIVGEYWKGDVHVLSEYLKQIDYRFALFDAPLVYKFSKWSLAEAADMRDLLNESLVSLEPRSAVTFVMNHDTQPSQALEAPITEWFVPLGYALIMLRMDGYPCVFYGDLYGISGGVKDDWQPPTAQGKIPDIVLVRKLYAYGEQNDYFDHPNLIGWVRRGTWDRPDGCAVLLSNVDLGQKRMYVGESHAGETWRDVIGWEWREAVIGKDGWALFHVGAKSVSIYVNKAAQGREQFGQFQSKIY